MGTQKTRTQLENVFSAGKTPSSSDYSDLFASFYNKSDDGAPSTTGVLDSGDTKELSYEYNGNQHSVYAIPLYEYNDLYDIVLVHSDDPSNASDVVVCIAGNSSSLELDDFVSLPATADVYMFVKKMGDDYKWAMPSSIAPEPLRPPSNQEI